MLSSTFMVFQCSWLSHMAVDNEDVDVDLEIYSKLNLYWP